MEVELEDAKRYFFKINLLEKIKFKIVNKIGNYNYKRSDSQNKYSIQKSKKLLNIFQLFKFISINVYINV